VSTAVGVAAALLLAACGGTSAAPTQAPSTGPSTAASSTATDRQADVGQLNVRINNNSDVAVTLRVLEVDPSDWEAGGNPDQFNNVNLGVNAWKGAAITDKLFNDVSPFRLQFWKYSPTTAEPTELLADINLEVENDPGYGWPCGLTIRGFPDMVPCNYSAGSPEPVKDSPRKTATR